MPTLELTADQLAVLRAGWAYFAEDPGHLDTMAEALEITPQERGAEDDDGNEIEDYDEANDPVAMRIDEVGALLDALV